MTSAVFETTLPDLEADASRSGEHRLPARQILIGLDEPLARAYCERGAGARDVPSVLQTGADLLAGRALRWPSSDRSDERLGENAAPLRVILFATPRVDRTTRLALDLLSRLSQEGPIESLTLVHSCGALLADGQAAEQEWLFREFAATCRARFRIVRCGVSLTRDSIAARRVRRWSWISPLLSSTPATAFVPLEMMADAVQTVSESTDGPRVVTLLGPNRPWREVLREQPRGPIQQVLAGLASVLSWLLVGVLLRVVLRLVTRWSPRRRRLDLRELRPNSAADLISLFNRWTAPHVQVCGYNNGVTHFGWRFPGKTLVTTCDAGRLIRVLGDRLTVDAGATLKQCLDVLSSHGRDLIVAPNFSYVAAGTAFFVPIHGSGCDVSTLGDTIESVLLWDPHTMRFVRARRGDTTFAETMYHRGTGWLLLRLTLRTRGRERYIVSRETLTRAEADQLLSALSEPGGSRESPFPSAADEKSRRWQHRPRPSLNAETSVSNVEIRKHRAADEAVEVSRYRIDRTDAASLNDPRDRLGRVWDRLEENRVAAFLFHAFVRRCAYHVELFMTPDEFRTFWNAHRTLPLSKIQLRRVRRDGMPHSPMRDEDMVSADLFMMRRHRGRFLAFVREQLPSVRFNPGKQSLGDEVAPSR